MATFADLQTYLDAAATAIDAGDNATAKTKITLARTVRAQLPGGSEADGSSVTWAGIDDALDALEATVTEAEQTDAAAAVTDGAGPMRRTRWNYRSLSGDTTA